MCLSLRPPIQEGGRERTHLDVVITELGREGRRGGEGGREKEELEDEWVKGQE